MACDSRLVEALGKIGMLPRMKAMSIQIFHCHRDIPSSLDQAGHSPWHTLTVQLIHMGEIDQDGVALVRQKRLYCCVEEYMYRYRDARASRHVSGSIKLECSLEHFLAG